MLLEPPPHLSPSSIAVFQQCPLRFKFSKIDGLREPDTEATIMGNFVHEILEMLFKMPSEDRTVDSAKAVASALWNEGEWKSKVTHVIGKDENKLREFRWKSWWCLENYFKIENPQEIEPDGIEHEVNDLIDGVKIKGFIDRWSSTGEEITVSDYKTGKTPAPKYRKDKFVQLLIYAILLEQETGIPAKTIELLYLKEGKVLSSDVKEEDISHVKSTIVNVHSEMMKRCEVGKFEYKTSTLCGWCSFKKMCPAWT